MIRNVTQNTILSMNPQYASDWWTRLRGMIGRRFDTFDAMVFQRCGCVHTLFMQIPLDIVMTDAQNRVVGLFPAVHPWRFWLHARGAVTVIEMQEGAIQRLLPAIGDQLDICAESAAAEKDTLLLNNTIQQEPLISYRRNGS